MQIDRPRQSTTIIRPGPEMAEPIYEIAEACGLAKWSVSAYREELGRETSLAGAAVDGGRLYGFIIGRVFNEDAEILNIGVRPEFQRKHIGANLMNWFIAECLKRSAVTIWLEARKSNFGALAFYGSFAFGAVSVRRNYYSDPVEDAVVLRSIVKTG